MTLYRNNPMLMTVMGANPGPQYQGNPPAYFIIDPETNRIMGIARGHPMHSYKESVAKGRAISRRLGHEVIHVVHPYVPKGFRIGTEVSPLFYNYGANLIHFDGTMSPRMRPNPPRRVRRPDDAIDTAIGHAWPRLMSGVQIPMLDIPRIFRDIKLEIASGLTLDQAVLAVGARYRINRNPGGLGAAVVGGIAGAVANRMMRRNPNPARSPWAVCRAQQKRLGWSKAKTERCVRQVKAKAKPNPSGAGRRKTTMPIEKFAALLKKKGDPKLWADFVKKVKGYQKWTHGTLPKQVTLERVDKPGMSGLWLTYDLGKSPETTYMMPKGSKRKGAWKHPWSRMPNMKGDPESGIILTKLVNGNRLTDFMHG